MIVGGSQLGSSATARYRIDVEWTKTAGMVACDLTHTVEHIVKSIPERADERPYGLIPLPDGLLHPRHQALNDELANEACNLLDVFLVYAQRVLVGPRGVGVVEYCRRRRRPRQGWALILRILTLRR
jgi:hypothetical protein